MKMLFMFLFRDIAQQLILDAMEAGIKRGRKIEQELMRNNGSGIFTGNVTREIEEILQKAGF